MPLGVILFLLLIFILGGGFVILSNLWEEKDKSIQQMEDHNFPEDNDEST